MPLCPFIGRVHAVLVERVRKVALVVGVYKCQRYAYAIHIKIEATGIIARIVCYCPCICWLPVEYLVGGDKALA